MREFIVQYVYAFVWNLLFQYVKKTDLTYYLKTIFYTHHLVC